MIRRVILLMLLGHTMGFLLLTFQIISLYKYHVKQQIAKGQYNGVTIKLQIHTQESLNQIEDEFEFDNKFYDVVSVVVQKDGFVVTAVEDITEQLLMDLFLGNKWAKGNMDSNGTRSLFQLIYIAGTAILSDCLYLDYDHVSNFQCVLYKPDTFPNDQPFENFILNPPESVTI